MKLLLATAILTMTAAAQAESLKCTVTRYTDPTHATVSVESSKSEPIERNVTSMVQVDPPGTDGIIVTATSDEASSGAVITSMKIRFGNNEESQVVQPFVPRYGSIRFKGIYVATCAIVP